jgi:simple sugar transport system permease protein
MDWGMLLVFTAPITLAAVGETICQKSGVLNIGLEGSMLVGAFFAMLIAQATGSPWIAMCVGGTAGLLLALFQGWFTVAFAADQVVIGTAANLLALGVTSTWFREKFGQSGQLLSVPKIEAFHGIDAVILFLLACVPLTWLLLRKTNWGLVLRAAGEYPKAVESAGFSVTSLRMQGFALSGLFGGLGGAYLAVGIAGSFAENMTSGRGFVAIALVTFGRWNPWLVLAAGLIVGYAESLQFSLQAQGIALPHQLLLAMPYIVALVVLVLAGKGTLAPRSLGVAYRREK